MVARHEGEGLRPEDAHAIDRAADRETVLNEELAANATDYEKLTELGAQLRVLQAEKAGLEERWLEVASSLEG